MKSGVQTSGGTMLVRFGIVVSSCAFTGAVACAPRYVPPNLPAAQLAVVQVEERATVLTVDGLAPGRRGEPQSERTFAVGPGCREIVVTYEESFWNTNSKSMTNKPLLEMAANAEHHDYSTQKPIHFRVNAKGGRAYWVTASFNGAQFFPRIAEIDPTSNETVAEILPDAKCL